MHTWHAGCISVHHFLDNACSAGKPFDFLAPPLAHLKILGKWG